MKTAVQHDYMRLLGFTHSNANNGTITVNFIFHIVSVRICEIELPGSFSGMIDDHLWCPGTFSALL